MKTYTVNELAKYFGVNRATIYRQVKQYSHHLRENMQQTPKGMRMTEEGRTILENLLKGVAPSCSSGATTCDVAQQGAKIRETAQQVATLPLGILDEYRERIAKQDAKIARQDATIEDLQQDIREVMITQKDERARADAIIFNLSQQVKNQTLMLEDMRQQSSTGIFRRFWSWLQGTALNIEIGDNRKKERQPGLRPVSESKAA